MFRTSWIHPQGESFISNMVCVTCIGVSSLADRRLCSVLVDRTECSGRVDRRVCLGLVDGRVCLGLVDRRGCSGQVDRRVCLGLVDRRGCSGQLDRRVCLGLVDRRVCRDSRTHSPIHQPAHTDACKTYYMANTTQYMWYKISHTQLSMY